MTTITTVFGLAPLVLFPGAGSELYRGLGSVLLGGLLISTVFTLILVPSMFSLAYQLFQWLSPSRRGKSGPNNLEYSESPPSHRRTAEPTEELSPASVASVS
jgi:HAE1 family hydrophobic/amphiphilic exporter-1